MCTTDGRVRRLRWTAKGGPYDDQFGMQWIVESGAEVKMCIVLAAL